MIQFEKIKAAKLIKQIPKFMGLIILFSVSIIFLLFSFLKMDITVRAGGRVYPLEYVEIQPQIEGTINKLYVKEGDQVYKGQLLAEMDNTLELAYLESARIALIQNINMIGLAEEKVSAAKIKRMKEKEDLEIAKESLKLKLISRSALRSADFAYKLALSDYKTSLKELKLAQSVVVADTEKEALEEEMAKIGDEKLRVSEADIKIWKEKLERKKVYSPIEGIILTLDVELLKGQFFRPGQGIMTVGNLEEIVFKAEIPEEKYSQIKVGQEANIYIDAFPHTEFKIFKGKVIKIAPMFTSIYQAQLAEEAQEKKPFKASTFLIATIKIDDPKVKTNGEFLTLKPGLTGETDIIVRRGRISHLIGEMFKRGWQRVTNIHLHF